MNFKKYMHIERYGKAEVEGIEIGQCYIFPKLDGTNASVWLDDDGAIKCGSRNRELTLDDDNAGFCKWVDDNFDHFTKFFKERPDLRLYGEWLVPHTLKTYNEDAWRKFYIFDVYDERTKSYCTYEYYQPILEEWNFDYIPPICIINNTNYDQLVKQLDQNVFLIEDGKGVGEGIVIKNYNFINKFGRQCFAKLIKNTFKEKFMKGKPTVKNGNLLVEEAIVNRYVTKELVDKEFAKIVNANEGWSSKYIPRLLNTVYHCLVVEDLWDALKHFKRPTINFKLLATFTTNKVKELKSELFE